MTRILILLATFATTSFACLPGLGLGGAGGGACCPPAQPACGNPCGGGGAAAAPPPVYAAAPLAAAPFAGYPQIPQVQAPPAPQFFPQQQQLPIGGGGYQAPQQGFQQGPQQIGGGFQGPQGQQQQQQQQGGSYDQPQQTGEPVQPLPLLGQPVEMQAPAVVPQTAQQQVLSTSQVITKVMPASAVLDEQFVQPSAASNVVSTLTQSGYGDEQQSSAPAISSQEHVPSHQVRVPVSQTSVEVADRVAPDATLVKTVPNTYEDLNRSTGGHLQQIQIDLPHVDTQQPQQPQIQTVQEQVDVQQPQPTGGSFQQQQHAEVQQPQQSGGGYQAPEAQTGGSFQQQVDVQQPQNTFQSQVETQQPQTGGSTFQQQVETQQPEVGGGYQTNAQETQTGGSFQQQVETQQPQDNFHQQQVDTQQPQNNFQQQIETQQPQGNFQQQVETHQPQTGGSQEQVETQQPQTAGSQQHVDIQQPQAAGSYVHHVETEQPQVGGGYQSNNQEGPTETQQPQTSGSYVHHAETEQPQVGGGYQSNSHEGFQQPQEQITSVEQTGTNYHQEVPSSEQATVNELLSTLDEVTPQTQTNNGNLDFNQVTVSTAQPVSSESSQIIEETRGDDYDSEPLNEDRKDVPHVDVAENVATSSYAPIQPVPEEAAPIVPQVPIQPIAPAIQEMHYQPQPTAVRVEETTINAYVTSPAPELPLDSETPIEVHPLPAVIVAETTVVTPVETNTYGTAEGAQVSQFFENITSQKETVVPEIQEGNEFEQTTVTPSETLSGGEYGSKFAKVRAAETKQVEKPIEIEEIAENPYRRFFIV
ncbi:unnamed protein product [Caenorhabditis bovis]|uniref:Uncharacterized protein n=1 Tax=Caenorhabditis bovis TaxID=2654633 RepID=A0A8S1EWM9_9PELO|nr:unnamed protein product [Caenorhabditis bovis]